MNQNQDYLKDISEIRDMMERSSRFISLSGLSGVFAGVYALAGAGLAHILIKGNVADWGFGFLLSISNDLKSLLLIDASAVLLLAVSTGIFFTTRKARSAGLKTWDSTSRRLIINLLIPLAAGGIFSLILLNQGMIHIVVSSTLLFYGLSLVNASKYTFRDIRYLGLMEIVLGLVAATMDGYGLLFWSIGFGWLHIIYGAWMYFKYEW